MGCRAFVRVTYDVQGSWKLEYPSSRDSQQVNLVYIGRGNLRVNLLLGRQCAKHAIHAFLLVSWEPPLAPTSCTFTVTMLELLIILANKRSIS